MSDSDQDPRVPALNELLEAPHEGADYTAEHILSVIDAADTAARIRRMTVADRNELVLRSGGWS